MALLSLIFDKPKRLRILGNDGRNQNTQRELLIIDSSNNISHRHEATPTKHPVESGAQITDNVDLMPDILTFEGTISEAPITIEQAIAGNVAGAASAISGLNQTALGTVASTGIAKLGGELLGDTGNRVLDAHNQMLQLQKEAIPVDIQTGLRTYKDMVLTSYNPVESTRVGNSLVFTATFEEIVIVQSEVSIVPEIVTEDAQAALDTANKGNKVAEVASEPVARTFAASLVGL